MTPAVTSPKNTNITTVDEHCVGESNYRMLASQKCPKATRDPIKYPEGNSCCHFLDLPAELRSAIYSAALRDSAKGLPLLRTCRQIHMESTTVVHQRPISFSSQAKLFSWIAETQSAELKRVNTMTLHLTDIDLSSLFDPRPVAGRRDGRSSSCWYLYSQELLKLDQALQSLPGLVHLTVIAPERSTSLVRGMYLSFLEVIPQRVPELVVLTVYDQESLLQKVPSLRQLSNVVFLDKHDSRTCFMSPVKAEPRELVKIKMETEW